MRPKIESKKAVCNRTFDNLCYDSRNLISYPISRSKSDQVNFVNPIRVVCALSSFKPYMRQPQFQSAEEFAPNAVVVMIGTNDARSDTGQLEGSFDNDYNQLIDSFRALSSDRQVFVVEPPPVFDDL